MLVIVPAQVIGFARYEAGGAESAGPLLIGLAMLGVAFLDRRTRERRAVVAADDTHRPRVARVGNANHACRRGPDARGRFAAVFRWWPSSVSCGRSCSSPTGHGRCTPRELAAIAAHEAAHVHAHDNLLRLLFRLTPGASMSDA